MSQLDDRYSQFPVTFLYIAQKPAIVAGFFMVGLFGFEPKTSSMSTKRSNQLSYNPMSDECIIHDMRETCKMLFCNFLHMARQTLILKVSAGLAVKVALTCRTTFC